MSQPFPFQSLIQICFPPHLSPTSGPPPCCLKKKGGGGIQNWSFLAKELSVTFKNKYTLVIYQLNHIDQKKRSLLIKCLYIFITISHNSFHLLATVTPNNTFCVALPIKKGLAFLVSRIISAHTLEALDI